MKSTAYISANSPKNIFWAEISFDKAVKGIGSVISRGAMTLEEAKSRAESAAREYTKLGRRAYIVISQNLSTYPEFNWTVVEKYELR